MSFHTNTKYVRPPVRLLHLPTFSTNQSLQDYSKEGEKEENPGPIPADSLAAESSKNKGVFSKNHNSTPSDVEGGKSTFTNIDTQGVTELEQASNKEERADKEDERRPDEEMGKIGPKYAEGVGGQGGEEGEGTRGVYSTRGTSLNESSYVGSGQGSSGSTGPDGPIPSKKSSVSTAPGYTAYVQDPTDRKPKGKNLTSEGFDDEKDHYADPTDIGGENDPARLAEAKILQQNEEDKAAGLPVTASGTSGNTYGGLGNDETL